MEGTEGNQPPAFFIDKDINILVGADARKKMEVVNDRRYIDGNLGVIQVDEDRWRDAQQYERRTWMEAGARSSNDHNDVNAARFGDYDVLRGRHFRSAIEVGCGPFTNMRMILRRCSVDRLTLLDPLSGTYLAHRNCSYRQGRFRLDRCSYLASHFYSLLHFGRRFRAGRPRIVESTIEDFGTDEKFDLLVMINVIEHCRDARRVLANLRNLLALGGVLVFGDTVYPPGDLRAFLRTGYDAGHPLRITAELVDPFLSNGFTPLLFERYPRRIEFGGVEMPCSDWCFIGKC